MISSSARSIESVTSISSAIPKSRHEEADTAGKGRRARGGGEATIGGYDVRLIVGDRHRSSRLGPGGSAPPTAPRRGPAFLSQSGRALPKSGAPGAQRLFQYDAVLGFSASSVLRGPTLQRIDDILGDVSDQELRHGWTPAAATLMSYAGNLATEGPVPCRGVAPVSPAY